ncbi:MAG: FkbM family methyltransferase [Candidatus Kapabacteria bacterium]|nr:FkbM family methyltransferase [Candidatus Kapabacteria bacterium]
MNRTHNNLYAKCSSKQLTIEHACEVGVYMPESSNVIDFIETGKRTTLIEADPESIALINKRFGDYPSVSIHSVAVFNRRGRVKLSRAKASTFISELTESPALVNDSYQKAPDNEFETDCVLFSDLDDGKIDLLSIDIEGAEWFVLSHMKSMPKVISVETHGKYYTNPYIKKIRSFMHGNDYQEWFMDLSDTVYLNKNSARVTLTEKLKLTIMKIRIFARRMKKVFRRRK